MSHWINDYKKPIVSALVIPTVVTTILMFTVEKGDNLIVSTAAIWVFVFAFCAPVIAGCCSQRSDDDAIGTQYTLFPPSSQPQTQSQSQSQSQIPPAAVVVVPPTECARGA